MLQEISNLHGTDQDFGCWLWVSPSFANETGPIGQSPGAFA